FSIVCWLLWKNRNEWTFQGSRPTAQAVLSQLQFWKQTLLTASEDAAETRSLRRGVKEWKHIAWSPAPDPWVTLNTDGSHSERGHAAAGGVLHTSNGDIVAAFTMNLGVCSIIRAELRGIIEGMHLAWNYGIRRLAIQTDSAYAVQILTNHKNSDHQHASLACSYLDLTMRDWEVSLTHIYKESNFMADSLAAKGHVSLFGTHLVEEGDPFVAPWIAYDRLNLGWCCARCNFFFFSYFYQKKY
ncbi:Putative ribonuclease H protein At1g65750, partial [Linum perenne]